MPTNNAFIMMGLAMAGLWFLNRGGSEDDQVDQLAGAAMMASGEGTAPNAPFQAYSAPGNPSFFFNEGGQMTKVPGAPVPFDATSGEDIGSYPGGRDQPELEFEVERSDPPIGTTDPSPTTPQFAGFGDDSFITSTIWDNQAAIAAANAMPLLAVQTTGGKISVLGSNVDISTLSSDEGFRAINVGTGDVFTSDRATVAEAILQGYFTPPTKKAAAASDEDIGGYPGGGDPPELEFTVDQTNMAAGTFDISLTTPQFAGTSAVNITPATIWDEPSTEWFGAFGPSAVDTIKSTLPVLGGTTPGYAVGASSIPMAPATVPQFAGRREPSYSIIDYGPGPRPAWAGGDNWWDEG